MRFIASYLPKHAGEPYYRTIWADTLNEATRQAEKWRKKTHILEKVEQVL